MADIQISGDAAYTYQWNAPTAINDGTSLMVAGMTGQAQARIFKETGGVMSNKIVQILPEVDEHNNPCLLIQAGYDNEAFWSRHNKESGVWTASAPEGTKDFGTPSFLSFPGLTSYAQVLSYGAGALLLTRVANNSWYARWRPTRSDPWGDPFELFRMTNLGNKVYMCHGQSGTPGKFHVAVYGHPDISTFGRIAYFIINLVDQTIETSAGVIANLDGTNLPLEVTDFDTVWDKGTSNHSVRLFCIGEAHGEPVVLYAKWWDGQAPRYYRARRLSGSWGNANLNINAPIFAYSGSANYIGGADLSRNGQAAAFLSIFDTATDKWHIKKYTINTDFTFTLAGSMVNSSLPLVRPVSPRGQNNVICQQLVSYAGYTNFESKILERD